MFDKYYNRQERMVNESTFSIYNPLANNAAAHPLKGLVPDSTESGWQVARNGLKALNHLKFLSKHEQIAAELGMHRQFTPGPIFDFNMELLEQHQAGKLSTGPAIQLLCSSSANRQRNYSEAEFRTKLTSYAQVRHTELHPSDLCNLRCRGCTYHHDRQEEKPPNAILPLNTIGKIAEALKPVSMCIVGGGEPTLYPGFQGLIREIENKLPGLQKSLITNGTVLPKGDWPNWLNWIRISLDASGRGTYTEARGKDLFDRVKRNFLRYLDFQTRYVGLSFLFSKTNVHDYVWFIDFAYKLVKKHRPDSLHRVNLQFRPLREDSLPSGTTSPHAVTPGQIRKTVHDLKELSARSYEIRKFIKNNTNATAILGGNTHPPLSFDRCYYAEIFKIVRANGDLLPCFVHVHDRDYRLGNLLTDSPETIALNTLYIAAKQRSGCESSKCRQCHVNSVLERGLRGEIQPSTSLEVLADRMF